jgi:hypothetical protein
MSKKGSAGLFQTPLFERGRTILMKNTTFCKHCLSHKRDNHPVSGFGMEKGILPIY